MHCIYIYKMHFIIIITWSVAVAWWIESLRSGSIPGGVLGILGLCPLCCVLSYLVSGGVPDILLITDAERLALMLLSSVLVHSLLFPYRRLTHGHLN